MCDLVNAVIARSALSMVLEGLLLGLSVVALGFVVVVLLAEAYRRAQP